MLYNLMLEKISEDFHNYYSPQNFIAINSSGIVK